MESVVDKISKLLIEERHNYLTAFEEDKDRMPTQLYRQFVFTRLKKYVTSYAMLKILPQIKESELKGEALTTPQRRTECIGCKLRCRR